MAIVEFEGSVYEVGPQETVLEALIRGGADVAFSCRKGSCQVCLLRAVEGENELPEDGQKRLRPELTETGHFMPCITRIEHDIVVEKPDLSLLSVVACVADKRALAPGVVQLLIEPEVNLAWQPGQYIEIVRPDGLIRPYSIASLSEEDYFIELHVKQVEGGEMSTWIHQTLETGELITIRGPLGTCVYDKAFATRPMIFIGTSTGIAPLHGIVRDALRSGHVGPIYVYFGARTEQELYLGDTLEALANAHPNLHYTPCVSGPDAPEGTRQGRVSNIAFADHPEAAGHILYLCGNPNMINDARYRSVLAGVRRSEVFADPFESAHPVMPSDLSKIAATPADPEMWQALEEGAKLRRILEEFYEFVYRDPRLAPFFHNVTLDRAIAQQYAFLRDVFAGEKDFLGLRPHNAHHWMIISDDLFNYREDIFEDYLRRHEVREPLLRRWLALHELFRPEIVKGKERGIVSGGKEVLHEGYSMETLSVGSMCDGCFQEMDAGTRGRMHKRTGKLFCMDCGAKAAVNQFGEATS